MIKTSKTQSLPLQGNKNRAVEQDIDVAEQYMGKEDIVPLTLENWFKLKHLSPLSKATPRAKSSSTSILRGLVHSQNNTDCQTTGMFRENTTQRLKTEKKKGKETSLYTTQIKST